MKDQEGFEVILHETATEIQLRDLKATDTGTQQRIADELVGYVQRAEPDNLIINFIHIRHCATVAINGLLAVHRLLSADDARLKLCHVGQEVRQTLEVLNLTDSIFEIHDSLEDAIAAR